MATGHSMTVAPVAIWRPRRAPLIVCALVILSYVSWVLAVTQGWAGWLTPRQDGPMWIGLLMVSVSGIWILTTGTLSRISLGGTEVAVRNLRTHRVPLADILSVEATHLGLVITRRDLSKKSVTAFGFRKANAATWLRRQVRADRIAQTSGAGIGRHILIGDRNQGRAAFQRPLHADRVRVAASSEPIATELLSG